MRTAEEIIVNYDGESFQGIVFSETAWTYKECIAMINEARKEAIEECAKKAEVTDPYQDGRRIKLKDNSLENYIKNNPAKINKESILSLIKELK